MLKVKININVCLYVCIIYVCMYICMYACIYVCMYDVRMYICMFVFTYIQFSEKDQDILGIIGQVLVPISLVCMVLIILTYTCMR